MFRNGEYFALRVKGDSMIEAGIFDGDYAVIEKRNSAESGDIVAALIDDEATLKRLKVSGRKILLVPENKAYQPIEAQEVTILGKLFALFRRY